MVVDYPPFSAYHHPHSYPRPLIAKFVGGQIELFGVELNQGQNDFFGLLFPYYVSQLQDFLALSSTRTMSKTETNIIK
jgi:hypothetical protein